MPGLQQQDSMVSDRRPSWMGWEQGLSILTRIITAHMVRSRTPRDSLGLCASQAPSVQLLGTPGIKTN